jgi:multiple sugar transport system permease protein
VYLTHEQFFTVALGLQYFLTQNGGHWNWLMAVSSLMIIPLMVMFFFAQRLFIRGIVMSGSKG